ncbi:hypothetical protein SPBR_06848 [Sporothrix brasiliensis 5110]|uniref:Cryptic loci regulator 2 N-terminal domain-containing protein n=1 Tax=Sporothrix brasiliensis 5110 TaxID=1398154 RepID=A0A0C2ESY1_9PEZI|nr:uncharacterized protein SPBR_06848 [Sporothrix brasiliensis 5110]KIH89504.1 hypothetical protein SPBR_06848 [Sporothrix brasiliensis 5110]
MSSKPATKVGVGRPATKGTTLGSTPMAKSASSSSAAGAKSKASAATSTSTASSSTHGTSNGSSHPLQPYREILLARSDGVGYSTQQINDASRSAQPVSDALDDSHEFMRSWTVKLGKAIKYNLGGASSSSSGADPNNYLVRFPSGYSLHVRPGKTKDRDGPFVFGHPLGPLAAFRSPAELALHLLWLLSDSNERADCSCRLCVRMVSEAAASTAASTATSTAASAAAPGAAAPQPAKPSPRPPTETPVPVPVIPIAASPAVATGPATTAPATPVPPPTIAPAASLATAPATAPAQPARLPGPVGGGSGLFRPWELVWYQHFTQQSRGAWRLGIVLQLFPAGDGTEPPPSAMPGPAGKVRVAPLGIRGLHPPELTLETSVLRPFLSFSVPGMREGLQGLSYDQIDWQKLAWEAQQQQQQQQQQPPQPGHYDTAILALEASKSAANQINACFSLFNPLPSVSPTEQPFGGVFLGAEQIVIGDALRVSVKPVAGAPADSGKVSVEIMRVNTIVQNNGDVHFIGDVYRLAVTGPGLPPPPPPVYGPTGHILPTEPVFAEELAERNSHSHNRTAHASNAGLTWYWQLRERQSRRNENEVHGRFYASTRLAANLQNSEFLQRVAQQQPTGPVAGDDSSMMASALNRRQQVGGFMYQGERANRAATIGQAISVTLPPVAGVTEQY